MASTFGSLEIAKSGMMAYNAALQTTAHNVANIETKGYSKQTVNMDRETPAHSSPLTFSLVTCYITNNFTQAVKRRVHDRRLAKRAPTW